MSSPFVFYLHDDPAAPEFVIELCETDADALDLGRRLLKERPPVAGIAAPGMPAGSPGMEVPGIKPQPFNVMSFDAKGTTAIFAKY